MAPWGYPAEFRKRVVDLVEAGRPVAQVAAELGISDQSIYTWRRQARIDAGVEPGMSTEEHAESAALRKQVRELECELAIHRRATELLKADVDSKWSAAIRVMAAEGLPIEKACSVLGVSVSGYYSWLRRPPSARSIRHAWLSEVVGQVHASSRETNGAKRVHAELTPGLGRGRNAGLATYDDTNRGQTVSRTWRTPGRIRQGPRERTIWLTGSRHRAYRPVALV